MTHPNNPLQWRALVDPECPEVQTHHDRPMTDPLDLLDGLTYEEDSDWEVRHFQSCDRCQTYNQKDPEDVGKDPQERS